jgi:OPA family glycerol-3-phosphate transporter-like MFS transporter
MAWIGNRVVQSIGWSALIKVSSKWFHYSRYGTVAAILTCSYLLGDAAARQCMGLLLEHGAGWRTLFVFGASVAGLMFLANLVFLRESRVQEGHPEALANPKNVFSSDPHRPTGFLTLVLPLLRSRAFLIVCLLNFGATMVRETFNSWTPVYLHDFVGYTFSHAAGLSAIFPGVGAVSVLLCGWASDRLGPNTRSLLLVGGLAATAAALLLLTSMHSTLVGTLVPVMAIGLVAFCLLGPYSFLPGAFALDFGGKQAGAAASGLVDGTGYLGGVLAGWAMAQIAVSYGWGGVFVTLAVVSGLAALGAAYLYVLTARPKLAS